MGKLISTHIFWYLGGRFMSQTVVKANLKGNTAFQMDIDGHDIVIDASEEIGGNNFGPRPKKLLLAGLIGCTGIDVMLMLKKMKVELEDLKIEAKTDNTDEHPKVYENIHLTYNFIGKDLPVKSLERAVNLSQEKYCGASAMLRKATPITYEIIITEK